MRRADAQSRKSIERAVENQMRQEDRRLERIADGVAQSAAAAQPRILCRPGRIARVHEDERAELLSLRPEGIEPRRRQLLAFDAAANRRAAQPQLRDPVFELLGGEIGKLQRHRRQPDESIGMRGAPGRERLVFDPDDLPRELAIRRVPERVDAQDLDVDSLLVQRSDPLGTEHRAAPVGLVAA